VHSGRITAPPLQSTNLEEFAAECEVNEVSSLLGAYAKTLQLYKATFEVDPDPAIWPRQLLSTAGATFTVDVAISLVGIASSRSKGAVTDEQLVAELLWVREAVRAELLVKQARCPGATGRSIRSGFTHRATLSCRVRSRSSSA
jgi:hypothetical protein